MKYLLFLFFQSFFYCISTELVSQVTFVSWNIKDFGQSRSNDEIISIAKLINHADIVAIQEVVGLHPGGSQAVARLSDEL
ncbi:MAG TPA: endonuclease, partial [Saprospiraceae bacterium]|nr:endonuclease [Saprospiraceae bacterium]